MSGDEYAMVSMSAVWDRTTEFLSDNLAAVTPIAVGAFFVPMSLKGNMQPLAATAEPLLRSGLGLVGVALSIVSLWGTLALTALAVDPARPVRHAHQLALRRLLPAVGVWLIALAVFIALLLPFLLLFALYGVDLGAMINGTRQPLPDGLALPLIVCVLVLVPSGLWLWTRFASILFPVIVIEQRGVRAFGRVFALTGGAGWRIVGVFLLYFAVSQVAAFATKTVFGSVLRLLDPSDGALSLASVLTAVAVGVVETIFSVLLAVFTAKLYVALRSVYEGVTTSKA